jgi:hypothetical protein
VGEIIFRDINIIFLDVRPCRCRADVCPCADARPCISTIWDSKTLFSNKKICEICGKNIKYLRGNITKKPRLHKVNEAFDKSGGVLLSHINAVPLALVSLTSLFGMGRGGTSLP